MNETQLRAILHEQSEEFRRMEEKHQQYEDQLGALADSLFLSPEEQRRKKELKKKKLQLKDKMYELMADRNKELTKKGADSSL